MGKGEVLEFLIMRRMTGDHGYYRYHEIQEGLKRVGKSFSYPSIWRSTNSLFSDKMLEVSFDIDPSGLQRTAKFRAHLIESPCSFSYPPTI